LEQITVEIQPVEQLFVFQKSSPVETLALGMVTGPSADEEGDSLTTGPVFGKFPAEPSQTVPAVDTAALAESS